MMNYHHQPVLLASQHEKEKAIAQPFMERLSCTLAVHEFDTDKFGTFTGEVARTLTPYETCCLKAKTAAEQYNYRLCVASEGSFGAHPALPFIASAHELMVFIDRAHDLVIAEQLISQKTNYALKLIAQDTPLDDFLKQVQFPSHALTLQTVSDKRLLAKGIRDEESLHRHLATGFASEQQLYLGTDMRAMMNPTRMECIAELADKLALRIATLCSACGTPGFGFKSTQGAIPCALCGFATSLYQHEVWGCIACAYQEYKLRKDGLLLAEPTYCTYCNP